MAVLTLADRARLQWVVDYLEGTGGGNFDQDATDQLAKVFGSACGFTCCPASFRDSLRDAPAQTLLKLMLCGGDGLLIPNPAGDVILPDGTVIEPGGEVELPTSGPDTINLASACSYGILAASTITNTGATIVNGDLGLWPGTSVTGAPVVTGDTNINNAAAQQAQLDLTAAYNDAAGRPGGIPVAGNLGGQTLAPGLYKSTSSLEITSGDLTLDAGGNPNSVWIFQIASTLTTGNGRNIILAGGAQAANIFWQVGSSATLGTTSIFKGTILTLTSDTVTTGAVVEGRLLASNAAITMDSNNILAPPC